MNDQFKQSGVPEWVVTYGDVMSLLLTFFIMLAAMSEIRKDDSRYRAVVESLRERFGYEMNTAEIPGNFTTRNSMWQLLSNLGRARRRHTEDGGVAVEAINGERLKVEALRPGLNSVVGAAIYFDEDEPTLPDSGRHVLDELIPSIVGKPQKIEVRGHTSRKPVSAADLRDHWDLAYQRCYNTMQYLIDQGIEPQRIRLTSAAAYEPLNNALAPGLRKRNARVEVYLWDEQVDDYEQQQTLSQP